MSDVKLTRRISDGVRRERTSASLNATRSGDRPVQTLADGSRDFQPRRFLIIPGDHNDIDIETDQS